MNDPIREFQNKLNKLSNQAEALRPFINSCNDAMERSGIKGSIIVSQRSPGEVSILLVILIKDSLKEIVPLFRELAKEGIHTDKDFKPEDKSILGDTLGARQYSMADSKILVQAMVFGAYASDNNKSCRIVQTGTKEVPTYGVICDE